MRRFCQLSSTLARMVTQARGGRQVSAQGSALTHSLVCTFVPTKQGTGHGFLLPTTEHGCDNHYT
jgi:hypothetical protein